MFVHGARPSASARHGHLRYTPAPFPYQPQNEFEQAVVIVPWHAVGPLFDFSAVVQIGAAPKDEVVILTCLPLLGAQIGKIGGTLNLLKEKAKEGREASRREPAQQQFTACVTSPLQERDTVRRARVSDEAAILESLTCSRSLHLPNPISPKPPPPFGVISF